MLFRSVRLGSVVCSSWQSFLQERPYATAYRPFSVMESCTSNANPPVLIINLPCIRLCCPATVRLCRWVARPLPELRDGCLPRVCTDGGRAICCYDTEVPIYKGVCLWRARRCPLCQVACYSNRVRALSTHPTNLAIERLPENCFSPVGTS